MVGTGNGALQFVCREKSMIYNLLAQTMDATGLAGSGWANATIGGVAVALLVVLCFLIKVWAEERKNYVADQKEAAAQLVSVIQTSNTVVAGNTQAIASVVKQGDVASTKLDDLRERMMSRPCLLEK